MWSPYTTSRSAKRGRAHFWSSTFFIFLPHRSTRFQRECQEPPGPFCVAATRLSWNGHSLLLALVRLPRDILSGRVEGCPVFGSESHSEKEGCGSFSVETTRDSDRTALKHRATEQRPMKWGLKAGTLSFSRFQPASLRSPVASAQGGLYR